MDSTVVSDSGPLHYLILIEAAPALGGLFEKVLIPSAVRAELLNAGAPEKVRTWLSTPPSWLLARAVSAPRLIVGLHKEESEALQLALESRLNAVLVDDLDARHAARRLGLSVIGTVGLLELADERRLLRLPDAINKLRETNFFIAPQVLEDALERRRRRENKSGSTAS